MLKNKKALAAIIAAIIAVLTAVSVTLFGEEAVPAAVEAAPAVEAVPATETQTE